MIKSEYGKGVLLGMLLASCFLFGWNYRQSITGLFYAPWNGEQSERYKPPLKGEEFVVFEVSGSFTSRSLANVFRTAPTESMYATCMLPKGSILSALGTVEGITVATVTQTEAGSGHCVKGQDVFLSQNEVTDLRKHTEYLREIKIREAKQLSKLQSIYRSIKAQ